MPSPRSNRIGAEVAITLSANDGVLESMQSPPLPKSPNNRLNLLEAVGGKSHFIQRRPGCFIVSILFLAAVLGNPGAGWEAITVFLKENNSSA